MQLHEIERLAALARPTSEEDWGSDRQIDAQNAFFDAVQSRVCSTLFEQLTIYCLKATSDEMIDAGLRAARGEGVWPCRLFAQVVRS